MRSSRRRFFANIAAASLVKPVLVQAESKPVFAYVGTYSSPQGPEGSKGNGQGIYLFEMDPSTGILKQRELFANGSNPSWLALDASGRRLYAANEVATFGNGKSGSVSAYSIDRSTGHLTLLNTVSSEGAGPAHLSVHPSGKYVLVANYAGGSIAVLPIAPGGELRSACDVKIDKGPAGASHASSAPVGSFAISGHDRPHAHMIQSDASGQYVLSADLAMDRILVWKFDIANGRLTPNNPASVQFPTGDGPRHFAFHSNGRWLYSLQEESSTIVTFDYQAASGTLMPKQTLSTLPKGFGGTNFTSEIRVSANGRFVYAANRLHDSLAVFSIGESGTLTLLGETWTRGDYPRSFTADPTGSFVYSCNQRSDAIATFRVDKTTGELSFTGQYTAVGTPAIIIFLT